MFLHQYKHTHTHTLQFIYHSIPRTLKTKEHRMWMNPQLKTVPDTRTRTSCWRNVRSQNYSDELLKEITEHFILNVTVYLTSFKDLHFQEVMNALRAVCQRPSTSRFSALLQGTPWQRLQAECAAFLRQPLPNRICIWSGFSNQSLSCQSPAPLTPSSPCSAIVTAEWKRQNKMKWAHIRAIICEWCRFSLVLLKTVAGANWADICQGYQFHNSY